MELSSHYNSASLHGARFNADEQARTRQNTQEAAAAKRSKERADSESRHTASKPNPVQNSTEASRVTREIEVEATELRPFVITATAPKATRAFLEVSAARDDFRMIDIYV